MKKDVNESLTGLKSVKGQSNTNKMRAKLKDITSSIHRD